MSECLSCSTKNDGSALFCVECGQPLLDADALDAPDEPVAAASDPAQPEMPREVEVTPPASEAPALVAETVVVSPSAASDEVVVATPRRRWVTGLAVGISVVAVVLAGLAVTALLAWPQATLSANPNALASVVLPSFAGQVAAVDVRSAAGARVPVELRQAEVWPLRQLGAGERLTVQVTVSRPAWVGWLVGHSQSSSFTVETPIVHLRDNLLNVKAGKPVSVVFDAPVERIAIKGSKAKHLPTPQTVVSVGVVARGSKGAGKIQVAAAARSWERLSAPILVSWFAERPYPQMLVEPATTTKLTPGGQLTLTFSDSISKVLGKAKPKLTPAVPGSWQALDTHTLAFRPTGRGFGLGATVRVDLPAAVHVAGQTGGSMTRTLQWQVAPGSMLRLEQMLAQLGYLPLDWQATSEIDTHSPAAQVAAAVSPPAGQFAWRYPTSTPKELRALWREGKSNKITYGAVMVFEDTHRMPADGVAGPTVWSALIDDAIAGKRRTAGYSYVFVHRRTPQLLTLWSEGRVILTSPGNTGVPAAPTQLGTYPVFEHIPVGTMSGTNPDGSSYKDPGIRWISYFNGGDALHSFNRASFGTPQSLGCVELPMAAAAKVWPYTPIGTLVTIED